MSTKETIMKKGDLVFYRQRTHEILMVDGPYLLIRDVRRGTVQWVTQENVMKLPRKEAS
jgi:hypothetical protein